jgi:hypothetical protein
MSPAEFNFLHIFHISSVLLLIGATFYAFAAPPQTKTRVAILSGIAALLVLVSGFRMWQVEFGMAPAGWIVVKLICWLAIASFSSLAYRRREKAWLWITLTIVLAIVAVTMAYVKPSF